MEERTILITGGAGFIGSNFVIYFLKKYPQYRVVNLDLLTYAGSLDNIKEVLNNPNHIFVKGDINNRGLLEFLFSHYNITGVIHFAAESHVDNSIKEPDKFIKTNINGTFTLLDVAYRYWMKEPFVYKDDFKELKPRFHHVSTDEVYGSLKDGGYFTEKTPYAPNSPYSASKAASDFLVRAYNKTYGLNVTVSNCSNNYGPKQHEEKLIPTIIKNAIQGNPIPIYGDGKNVRDWLYVEDHVKAIDLIFHKGRMGETYNIGTNNELTNIELANMICEILDMLYPVEKNKVLQQKGVKINTYKDLVTFVKDRPGHDRRYAIDATKIKRELGWKAEGEFKEKIRETVEWYCKEKRWCYD